jgi:predicted nucleic acid-binding protein
MKIVVDVNVVLSSLVKKGNSFDAFALNSLLNKFDFVAPEFLLTELEKHNERIFLVSGLSRETFDNILKLVLEQITFISELEFSEHISNAEELLSGHLKDVQYLALALKLNSPIFSGDGTLRRILSGSSVKVLPPRELLDLLSSS